MVKQVKDLIDGVYSQKAGAEAERLAQIKVELDDMDEKALAREIKRLEKAMLEHARNLEFEQAARTRDQLALLKQRILGAGPGEVVAVN